MNRHTTPTVERRRLINDRSSEQPSLRQRVYVVLEEGQTQGLLSRVVEMVTITLIVTNVIMFMLATTTFAPAAR